MLKPDIDIKNLSRVPYAIKGQTAIETQANVAALDLAERRIGAFMAMSAKFENDPAFDRVMQESAGTIRDIKVAESAPVNGKLVRAALSEARQTIADENALEAAAPGRPGPTTGKPWNPKLTPTN